MSEEEQKAQAASESKPQPADECKCGNGKLCCRFKLGSAHVCTGHCGAHTERTKE